MSLIIAKNNLCNTMWFNFLSIVTRGKEKLEYPPCEHFLQGFVIYRAFFRAK